jgi:hypothetical protein
MNTTSKWLAIVAVAFVAGSFIASSELRAYAANTVFSTDIVDGEVKSVDIGNGEVKTADLGGNSVTASKIKDGEVKTADIAAGAVNSAKVADETITYADASRAFLRIEHRNDCNCGGTGWDPDGTKASAVVHDDRVTPDSAVFITVVGFAGFNVINCGTVTQAGFFGHFVVNCDKNIPQNAGLNYAIFNK